MVDLRHFQTLDDRILNNKHFPPQVLALIVFKLASDHRDYEERQANSYDRMLGSRPEGFFNTRPAQLVKQKKEKRNSFNNTPFYLWQSYTNAASEENPAPDQYLHSHQETGDSTFSNIFNKIMNQIGNMKTYTPQNIALNLS